MIPKKIHYCWLSGEEMPGRLKQCMESWKLVMPDYEIIRWDRSRFNVDSNPFVAEAVQGKRWALASDYIRIYALYNEGGIYLDSDVEIVKKFDEFLSHNFFTAVEYHQKAVDRYKTAGILNDDGSSKDRLVNKPGIGIQAAVMGSVRGHPFLLDCLNYYRDKRGEYAGEWAEAVAAVGHEGTSGLRHGLHDEAGRRTGCDKIAPGILAMIAESYGFKYKDEKQVLNDMLILPSEVFATYGLATSNSYAIHYCEGSWRRRTILKTVRLQLKEKSPKLYEYARLAKRWVGAGKSGTH
jgi:hypothetical protein